MRRIRKCGREALVVSRSGFGIHRSIPPFHLINSLCPRSHSLHGSTHILAPPIRRLRECRMPSEIPYNFFKIHAVSIWQLTQQVAQQQRTSSGVESRFFLFFIFFFFFPFFIGNLGSRACSLAEELGRCCWKSSSPRIASVTSSILSFEEQTSRVNCSALDAFEPLCILQ